MLTEAERVRIEAGLPDGSYARSFYRHYGVGDAEKNVDWAGGQARDSADYRIISKVTRGATLHYSEADRARLVGYVQAEGAPERAEVFLRDSGFPVDVVSGASVAASVINRPFATPDRHAASGEMDAQDIKQVGAVNDYLMRLRVLAARNANAHPEIAFLLLTDPRFASRAVKDAIYRPGRGVPTGWEGVYLPASEEYQKEFGRVIKSALGDYPASGDTPEVRERRLDEAERAWTVLLGEIARELGPKRIEGADSLDHAVRQIAELTVIYFAKDQMHFDNPDFRKIHRAGIVHESQALAAYQLSLSALLVSETVQRLAPWKQEFEKRHGRSPDPGEVAEYLRKTQTKSALKSIIGASEAVLFDEVERDLGAKNAVAGAAASTVSSRSGLLLAGANVGMRIALPAAVTGGTAFTLASGLVPGLAGLAIYKLADDHFKQKADDENLERMRGVQGIRTVQNRAVLDALVKVGLVSEAEAADATRPDPKTGAPAGNPARSEMWMKAGNELLPDDVRIRQEKDLLDTPDYRQLEKQGIEQNQTRGLWP